MSLDELTSLQKKTGEEIKQIIVNYKKDSPSRKSLDYLQKRLTSLVKLWEKFDTTDSDIRTHYSANLDHHYFTSGYYNTVRTGYDETTQDINSRIEALKVIGETDSAQNNYQQSGKENNMRMTDGTNLKQTRQISEISQKNQNNLINILQKQGAVMNVLRRTLADLPIDNKCYSEQFYQLKIKTIEQYWDDVQRLHYKIWDAIDEPTSIEYNGEEYFNLADEVQNKLVQLYSHIGQQSTTNQTDNNTNALMKLPKITLPRFDGDYLKWRQFHDLFTEVVHKQPMSECQKMWYLKSSLMGEAEKLVRHLTISDMNYSAAWKIITERYENTRLLVTALLNRLLSQPNIVNESSSAIRALHDTTQECLLGLENLGINTNDWDPLLLHLLIKKLDRNTHTLYEQSLTQPRAIQSIKDFLAFLETRFQSLEALGNKGKSSEDSNRKISTTRAFTSTVNNSTACSMCKGSHQLFSCRKFLQLTPTKRIRHVKVANVCFNCLGTGHRVDSCTSRGCTKCSKGTTHYYTQKIPARSWCLQHLNQ